MKKNAMKVNKEYMKHCESGDEVTTVIKYSSNIQRMVQKKANGMFESI